MALPEATVRVDASRTSKRSTAYSFDVRGRSFCLLVSVTDPTRAPASLLIVRSEPGEREGLLSVGAPFFAPRAGDDRVGVWLNDSTDWQEIRELVIESYCVLAPKKLIAQIGLES